MRIPISELNKDKDNDTIREIVERKLREDPKGSYAIQDIMKDDFGVKGKNIHKPFKDPKTGETWKKEDSKLYSQIYNILKDDIKAGKVKKQKYSRGYQYWWVA